MTSSEKPTEPKGKPLLYSGVPTALRNLRKRKKLGQKEVAANSQGLSATDISKIETGRKVPKRHHLPMLTRGLGVQEEEIWEEAKKQELKHYKGVDADVIAEPAAYYDPDSANPRLTGLMDLELERLPAEPRKIMTHLRNSILVIDAHLELLTKAVQKAYDCVYPEEESEESEGEAGGEEEGKL